jgi:hypothetical protein
VVSPVAIRSTVDAASNGSQTLCLPMERNLAGACGSRQMSRYLIFCACASISRYIRGGDDLFWIVRGPKSRIVAANVARICICWASDFDEIC